MRNIAATEFEILKLFWRHGNLSSKEIHERCLLKPGGPIPLHARSLKEWLKRTLCQRAVFTG
jgi:hypothetical protein